MQHKDSQIVAGRFFLALETLINDKHIRGVATFTKKYGINRRNLYQFKMNKEKDIFQVCWLTYLVLDYDVSAEWLLTGEGNFYKVKTAEKPQVTQR